MAESETGIRIIPPLLFLAAFLIAWFLYWLFPLSLGLPAGLRWIGGGGLVLAALAIVPFLFLAFRRVGSEYDIRKAPKALVTTGLFRWSRNPGYVALIVLGFGIAILFDNVWVALLTIVAAAIVRQEVILKEEAILERLFGDEYRQYKARVRRWI